MSKTAAFLDTEYALDQEAIKSGHLRAKQIAEAEQYQRLGYTFTEIAATMECPRDLIVDALYWDRA